MKALIAISLLAVLCTGCHAKCCGKVDVGFDMDKSDLLSVVEK